MMTAPAIPSGKSRFVLLLSCAVAVTLLGLGWLCWSDFEGYRFVTERLPAINRMEVLRGQILLLDEVLTMSARMSAATGDPQWEARYRRFDPQLDAALQEFMRLASTVAGNHATAQSDAANTKLVAMENRAFDLVRQGQRAAALQLLSSEEYETQKNIYATGMAEFNRVLDSVTASARKERRMQILRDVITTMILIPGLGLLWWVVLRIARRWRAALVQSNEQLNRQTTELQQFARQLDEKVTERTKQLKESELATLNMMEDAVRSREKVEQGYEALKREVAERKKVEEQFRQAQKMEAIGTLAGGIAHDFNNILAAINGYTELARMVLGDNPAVREYLNSVLVASGRAAALVRQILTFSRQEPIERHLIQLQAVVAECHKLLRATIPATIEINVSIAADAPTVLADTTQIHQVLMNLGTNAWHAMKDRTGRLQVKLERCVVDEAIAAAQPRLRPGVYARVSVSDTGSGMDHATLRRIFEPFFTTKPLGEGTGLGLAVVHGIMDSHDGAVTVFSQPGEGTVFHLYFPAQAGAAAVAAVDEGPVPRGQGERILFVDDEELLARLGQKTLTELGYETEIATDPAGALALVRTDPTRFALVLTDQTMPGMTGLHLANVIRQIRPGMPIILMTGFSASLTPARLEAAGIRQLLLKPSTINSLGTAVHAALSNPTSQSHG